MFKIIHNYKHELDQELIVRTPDMDCLYEDDKLKTWEYNNSSFCKEFDLKFELSEPFIHEFNHEKDNHDPLLHEDTQKGDYCVTYDYIYHADKTLTDMKFYFDGKIYDIKEKDLIIFDGSKTHAFYSYKGFGKRKIIVVRDME